MRRKKVRTLGVSQCGIRELHAIVPIAYPVNVNRFPLISRNNQYNPIFPLQFYSIYKYKKYFYKSDFAFVI